MYHIMIVDDEPMIRKGYPAKPAAGKNGSSDPAALVENIFQHAFPQGIDDHHHIKIDARIADDQFQVFVVDNGVGIAPDPFVKARGAIAAKPAGRS